MTQKKCNGLHCRCMNLNGQCPNMHPSQCVEHCPELVARAHPKPTYIEQAIRGAEKGGYITGFMYDKLAAIDPLNAMEILWMDPEWWRCLGVARGWGMSTKSYYKSLGIGNGRPIYRGEIYEVNSWIYYMHRFIDHLIAEKPAESFFEQLYSNK